MHTRLVMELKIFGVQLSRRDLLCLSLSAIHFIGWIVYHAGLGTELPGRRAILWIVPLLGLAISAGAFALRILPNRFKPFSLLIPFASLLCFVYFMLCLGLVREAVICEKESTCSEEEFQHLGVDAGAAFTGLAMQIFPLLIISVWPMEATKENFASYQDLFCTRNLVVLLVACFFALLGFIFALFSTLQLSAIVSRAILPPTWCLVAVVAVLIGCTSSGELIGGPCSPVWMMFSVITAANAAITSLEAAAEIHCRQNGKCTGGGVPQGAVGLYDTAAAMTFIGGVILAGWASYIIVMVQTRKEKDNEILNDEQEDNEGNVEFGDAPEETPDEYGEEEWNESPHRDSDRF